MDVATHEVYRLFFEERMLKGESVTDIRRALSDLCTPFEKRCAFCPNPATLLCDFIFGFEKKGTVEVPSEVIAPGKKSWSKPYEYDYLDFASDAFTCDLNICDQCATQGSPMFACAVGPMESKGEVIIRDFCPEHSDIAEPLRVMTPHEAQVERNQNAMRVLSRHPLVVNQAANTDASSGLYVISRLALAS